MIFITMISLLISFGQTQTVSPTPTATITTSNIPRPTVVVSTTLSRSTTVSVRTTTTGAGLKPSSGAYPTKPAKNEAVKYSYQYGVGILALIL
ncbi:hypothetical protein BC833DRAFT_603471, partial [Globomyces pollinis-pini]